MKLLLTAAVALAVLATGACADDLSGPTGASAGTVTVPNNHGGYNVAEKDVHHGPGAINVVPFFGKQGYAAVVVAHSHDKPKYILVPTVQDMGHGGKVTVYKRIYFATAEEAEAAKIKMGME